MAGLPEQELLLIQKARRGSIEAFNSLVLSYQDAVYTLAYRLMGESESAADAAQETFITAYRKLDTYRGGNFKSWLLRIASNTCYDELRRLKRRPATPIEELPGSESDDGPALPTSLPSPEQVAQQNELHAALQDCINALQDDQRLALVMSDIEGFSYQEIADTTGVQLGTVKSRLSRARAAMRHCLEAVQELLPAEYRLTNTEDY
jgi:RNA polymerase sigma-70 factor, ECF subfamily